MSWGLDLDLTPDDLMEDEFCDGGVSDVDLRTELTIALLRWWWLELVSMYRSLTTDYELDSFCNLE